MKDGKVTFCKFFGDFFSDENLPELEKSVIGKRYEREEISQALNTFSGKEIIMGISIEEILSCMFE